MAAASGDEDLMRQQVETLQARGAEDPLLGRRAMGLGARGRLEEARELYRRAFEVYGSRGRAEIVAADCLSAAVVELEMGFPKRAVDLVDEAVSLTRNRQVLGQAGGLLGLAGEIERAAELIAEAEERFPGDTLVQRIDVPAARAAVAIGEGDAEGALEHLESLRPYERTRPWVWLRRGRLYLALDRPAEAATEAERVLEHPEVSSLGPTYGLAHLLRARAYLAKGEIDEARRSYQDFLALMKDADEGVPVVEKARAEYATLPGVKG